MLRTCTSSGKLQGVRCRRMTLTRAASKSRQSQGLSASALPLASRRSAFVLESWIATGSPCLQQRGLI